MSKYRVSMSPLARALANLSHDEAVAIHVALEQYVQNQGEHVEREEAATEEDKRNLAAAERAMERLDAVYAALADAAEARA